MLSDISQINEYCRTLLIHGVSKCRTHKSREWLGDCPGWGQVVEGGGAGNGEVEDAGQKVQTSTYKMKSVLGV